MDHINTYRLQPCLIISCGNQKYTGSLWSYALIYRPKAPAVCNRGFKKWRYRAGNRFSSNFDTDKRYVEWWCIYCTFDGESLLKTQVMYNILLMSPRRYEIWRYREEWGRTSWRRIWAVRNHFYINIYIFTYFIWIQMQKESIATGNSTYVVEKLPRRMFSFRVFWSTFQQWPI